MNAAARNKQPPENIPVSASIFPCPYGWSSSAGLSDQRKPAQVITDEKMSLADSIPSAMRAYELPTTPTPILTIINATLMQIARIPSPSDSDGDRITVIVFGTIKSELVSPLIAAVFMRRWDIDQLAERAFTSTPASFSSALIKAEAFSLPKPRATADARFFSATRSPGVGDCKLAANFSMRPASLSMSLSAKLGEKSRFKIF